MELTLGRKTSFFKDFYNFTGLIKNSYLNKSKFYSGFAFFKRVKKNKLSEYFSAPFWDSNFFDKKEKFSVNLSKNASKHLKSIVWPYVAHFEEKNKFLFRFLPFHWFD